MTGIALRAVAALLVAFGAPALAAPAGRWVVVAAPRNPAVGNPEAQYRSDDPQLVGRLVTIAGATASFDGDYRACTRAAAVTQKVAAGRLLRQLIPDRTVHGVRRIARPADYGLRLAPAAPVAVTRYRCLQAATHGDDWAGAALFPIGGGRMALWLPAVEDHLLILAPSAGPIRASFACARARSAGERAICADPLLAGWDRSVARAFAQGQGDPAEQRDWLAERDRCGADKDCLHESMSTRTANLLR